MDDNLFIGFISKVQFLKEKLPVSEKKLKEKRPKDFPKRKDKEEKEEKNNNLEITI